MAQLSTALSRLTLPRIGQYVSRPEGFRTWLETGSYRVDGNVDGNEIIIADCKIAELLPFLSYDYERFALSSWETIQQALVGATASNAKSWVLLKIYYAGFFAAHALMRACGEGIVKLEKAQTEVLQASSDIQLTESAKIEAAMFATRVRQSNNGEISIELKRLPSKFGAHEGFWREFDGFLERLASRTVADGDPDAPFVVSGVAELQPALRPHDLWRSPWVSAVRNDINYQHKHGVWRPRRLNNRTVASIGSLALIPSAGVRLDYSLRRETVSAFASFGLYLSALSIELGDIIAANSRGARCFGDLWRRSRAEPA